MEDNWPYTRDTVSVTGLFPLLDEDETPAYLELGLRCRGRSYRAAILPVEEEWALSLRDESGRQLPGERDLYPTQVGAILAAMLTVIDARQGEGLP